MRMMPASVVLGIVVALMLADGLLLTQEEPSRLLKK